MEDETWHRLRRRGKTRFTKKLRRTMTIEEQILWKLLRNRFSRGVKFRRQVNIGPYIADFLCKEHRIIIEIDGGIHKQKERREYDQCRDAFLRDLGYEVLRIQNEEVHTDISLVLQKIHGFIEQKQNISPSPSQRRRG